MGEYVSVVILEVRVGVGPAAAGVALWVKLTEFGLAGWVVELAVFPSEIIGVEIKAALSNTRGVSGKGGREGDD